jgi:hypothetical protein
MYRLWIHRGTAAAAERGRAAVAPLQQASGTTSWGGRPAAAWCRDLRRLVVPGAGNGKAKTESPRWLGLRLCYMKQAYTRWEGFGLGQMWRKLVLLLVPVKVSHGCYFLFFIKMLYPYPCIGVF